MAMVAAVMAAVVMVMAKVAERGATREVGTVAGGANVTGLVAGVAGVANHQSNVLSPSTQRKRQGNVGRSSANPCNGTGCGLLLGMSGRSYPCSWRLS